ncbi:MAG: ATP-binding protein, partial [Candidatus Gastranaerophilales bacterium]|nr:ATP-binding protein [Candidatus Gastranaerophilales bacterium]
ITPEMQEKIFKRYEMALAIERKIGAGTGLFLAKRIMEAHKGSISFETEASIGTVFYITLPNSSDETDEA